MLFKAVKRSGGARFSLLTFGADGDWPASDSIGNGGRAEDGSNRFSWLIERLVECALSIILCRSSRMRL
jgi:hypothetical protein